MALSLGHTGTADPIEGEYFTRQSDKDSVLIHVHFDAVAGIARDAAEGLRSLPRRGVEVGGLLLGHVEPGERPRVWIERYQRLECHHRFGPQFALDEDDICELEKAAAAVYQSSDLTIVGFYRSHTHAGFQLEESDFELIARYFSDPGDLILLIKPESMVDISAQFFARDASGEVQPSGPVFPFRGRVVGSMAGDSPADPDDDPERTAKTLGLDRPAVPVSRPDASDRNIPRHDLPALETALKGPWGKKGVNAAAPTTPAANAPSTNAPGLSKPDAPVPAAKVPDASGTPGPVPPREAFRRLVPDFAPLEEQRRPARAFMSENLLPEVRATFPVRKDEPAESSPKALISRWWPALVAILLVAGAVWLLLPHPARREAPSGRIPSETASTEAPPPVRPLGLYVDSSGPMWRISWNPGATVFRGARSVALFVRDADDQNRIDLSPQDLQTGTYQYQAKGEDVTFRLEVTDDRGRLSAESFRLLKSAPAAPEKPPVELAKQPAEPPQTAPATKNLVRPRAIHKVPPVVPAGIRPRIRAPIPVDIRVNIDSHGRVTDAAPAARRHSGLESYLTDRALTAARQWRFDPARENGKAVPGSETIHFVFDR